MGESWAASAREPPALKASVYQNWWNNREGGAGQEVGAGRGDPASGAKSAEIFLTPSRQSEAEGRRERAARSATQTHTPGSQDAGCSGGRPRPEGRHAELSEERDTRGLTMTLLPASEHRQAARASRRVADWAEVSGRREEVQSAPSLLQPRSALRVPRSPQLLQPEPGPAHRARPQPALQPRVRATWPVLTFGPAALSCLRTTPEERATRSRAKNG